MGAPFRPRDLRPSPSREPPTAPPPPSLHQASGGGGGLPSALALPWQCPPGPVPSGLRARGEDSERTRRPEPVSGCTCSSTPPAGAEARAAPRPWFPGTGSKLGSPPSARPPSTGAPCAGSAARTAGATRGLERPPAACPRTEGKALPLTQPRPPCPPCARPAPGAGLRATPASETLPTPLRCQSCPPAPRPSQPPAPGRGGSAFLGPSGCGQQLLSLRVLWSLLTAHRPGLPPCSRPPRSGGSESSPPGPGVPSRPERAQRWAPPPPAPAGRPRRAGPELRGPDGVAGRVGEMEGTNGAPGLLPPPASPPSPHFAPLSSRLPCPPPPQLPCPPAPLSYPPSPVPGLTCPRGGGTATRGGGAGAARRLRAGSSRSARGLPRGPAPPSHFLCGGRRRRRRRAGARRWARSPEPAGGTGRHLGERWCHHGPGRPLPGPAAPRPQGQGASGSGRSPPGPRPPPRHLNSPPLPGLAPGSLLPAPRFPVPGSLAPGSPGSQLPPPSPLLQEAQKPPARRT